MVVSGYMGGVIIIVLSSHHGGMFGGWDILYGRGCLMYDGGYVLYGREYLVCGGMDIMYGCLSHVVNVERLDAAVGEVDRAGDGPDGVEVEHNDNADAEGSRDSHVVGRSGDEAGVKEDLAAGGQTKQWLTCLK